MSIIIIAILFYPAGLFISELFGGLYRAIVMMPIYDRHSGSAAYEIWASHLPIKKSIEFLSKYIVFLGLPSLALKFALQIRDDLEKIKILEHDLSKV